jgi:hypothetical protein
MSINIRAENISNKEKHAKTAFRTDFLCKSCGFQKINEEMLRSLYISKVVHSTTDTGLRNTGNDYRNILFSKILNKASSRPNLQACLCINIFLARAYKLENRESKIWPRDPWESVSRMTVLAIPAAIYLTAQSTYEHFQLISIYI